MASKERNKDSIAEDKVRWQIETMFGCLKIAGLMREETQLTMAEKSSKLMMLVGLGLCLAMLMGEIQVKVLQNIKMKLKKNKRYAKSFFRVGLDALQNALFNRHQSKKEKQLQRFIELLSCA